ncbi:hypothetical protein [Terricaulis sp.]|uniref:hypothetical protein n=1 Tax=Terricaulis sp. TaxID=2768686 RepID=UPI003784A647
MGRTALIALMMLAGCASAQRTLSYPSTWPDADIAVGTHRYQAWFHERDATILLERGPPAPLAQMLAQNNTMYAADRSEAEPVWRAAADAVLQPLGCQATEITGADQMREVSYACAGAVNVGAEVAARRVEWRRGVRVDDPTIAASPQRY